MKPKYFLKDEDIVSRTVNNDKKINSKEKRLKYTAFMDTREGCRTELSVLKTTDLVENNEPEIWKIANEFIYFNEKSPKVKGRADLIVQQIRAIQHGPDQLDVIFDGGKSGRHSTIQFYPTRREIKMVIAQKLQNISKHFII